MAASDSFRFPACSFIEKGTPAKTFFWEFCKIFKNIFLQNTSRWLLLLFTCSFEKFFRSPAYFVFKFRISTTRYNKKYFTSAFQALYTKTRRSYSDAFIYIKSLKIIYEYKLIYKGPYIKYAGGGAGGFYKFFKKFFVAQETIELNISRPSNFFRKYFMAPPINFSFLFKAYL